VAQIPALLISVAAAMVVSRVGKEQDVGSQIGGQVFNSPRRWAWPPASSALLGVIPGMPHLVFLPIAGRPGRAGLAAGAARGQGRRPSAAPPEAAANAEATWDDLQPVDTLGLEVGYRLIALVDKNRQGDLLNRIKGVRKKFAQDVGFLPPPVHIRDNLELKPSAYRVTLRGAVVGEGEAFPGMFWPSTPAAPPSSCPARAPPTRPSACPRCGSKSASGNGPNGRVYGG
jgi:flagellar biosynthesis protein FlhA